MSHYQNTPMQYTEIFSVAKFENFMGISLIVLIYLLKTLIVDTRYALVICNHATPQAQGLVGTLTFRPANSR